MSPRPCIGVTLEFADSLVGEVERRVRRAIEGAGGIAVIIPPSADADGWQAAYERLDGVLLMGGADVNPDHYGAAHHPLTVPATRGADITDLGLARSALADGLPILGVCRGAQVLAVASGGTLIQDVPSIVGSQVTHSSEWNDVARLPPTHRHAVQRERGSLIADLLRDAPSVNSYHHQAVDSVGDGLRIVARADDGVVEAIESTNGRFALGVQWHEEFHVDDARLTAVFAALVDATSRAPARTAAGHHRAPRAASA